mmetsp:Transcript_30329/g.75348  ORF Transcript_30329/g.75348 Transcript_30329/m.75348 type:complete len:441 (-) Transcript_30329:1174-2496(-)
MSDWLRPRPRLPCPPYAISSLPRLDVMMMRLLRKLTVRPCVSVTCPSSSTCSSTLKTSTCAFSISSKSTTEYGFWRTASVSIPPSSYPMYPGGAPMSRATECFSMYSLMSRRMSAPSVLNRYAAKALASSVLPTPVGPRNMKDATGPLGSDRSARERCTASATEVTACSCPMTRRCSSPSSCSSFAFSDATSLATGTPVHLLTTAAMSTSVTSSLVISPLPLLICMISSSVLTYSTLALATSSVSSLASVLARAESCSACAAAPAAAAASAASPDASAFFRIASAFLKLIAACTCFTLALASRRSPKLSSAVARLWSRLAFCSFSSSELICFCLARSFLSSSLSVCRQLAAIFPLVPGLYFSSASFPLIWSRSFFSWATLRSTMSRSSGLSVFCMCTAAAASSSKSIALSGRHRPWTYRAERLAAATTADSLILMEWCAS